MAAPAPQWRKEAPGIAGELRGVVSADSEANVVDAASFRVLHLLDYADAHGYPALPGTPDAPHRAWHAGRTPEQRSADDRRREAALHAYRRPYRQAHYLPGYCHNLDRAASDACAVALPGVDAPRPPSARKRGARAPGATPQRAATMFFGRELLRGPDAAAHSQSPASSIVSPMTSRVARAPVDDSAVPSHNL